MVVESVTGRPFSASMPLSMAVISVENPVPTASTTISAGIENSLPGTSFAFCGTKRPGSSQRISTPWTPLIAAVLARRCR